MERRRMAAGIPMLAMGSLIVALVAVPALAAVPRCFGEKATIVGTSGDDVLRGTGDDDVIAGLGGDDVISGKGGQDLICAGKGNDTVRAGGGIDLTFGGAGDDEIFGNAGAFNDAVPGPGDDFVDGGKSGEDGVIYLDAPNGVEGDLGTGTVTGHGTDEVANVEWLIGSFYDDVLTGTDNHDGLFGADGEDQLEGLGDDDFLGGGLGDDLVGGGEGFDYMGIYFLSDYYLGAPPAGPITVDLVLGTLTGEGTDDLTSIEGSQGSTGDDVMIGNAEDNEFTGLLEGFDTVDGGDGDDLIDGGDGPDDLDGGAGVDTLGNLDLTTGQTIDLGTQTISDGDTLAGFEGAIGTFFDDTIIGSAGPNEIWGADGDDTLRGLAGDDVLVGDFPGFTEGGTDSADGGDGTDICDAETEANCESSPSPASSLRFATMSRELAYHSILGKLAMG